MTVFRVNIDRDLEQLAGRSRMHPVGKNRDGKVESLSNISDTYYKTYRFWPLLWKINFSTVPDPNKTKLKMRLEIPMRHTITQIDRTYCDRIFPRWNRLDEAARLLGYWIDEEVEDRECMEKTGEHCVPVWARWNTARQQ